MTNGLEKELLYPASLEREDKLGETLLIDVLKDWARKTRLLDSEPLRNDVISYLKKQDKSLVTWRFQYGSLPRFSFENPTDAKYTRELHRNSSENPKVMSVLHYLDIEEYKF